MCEPRARLGPLLLTAALMTAACGEPAPAVPPAGDAPTAEWHTAGCALPRSPQTMTFGGQAMPVTPDALAEAMERISEGGRTRFADSYAGLEVDQRLVRAIVYRVPSPAFDAFIRDSARDTCVVVRDAAYPLAELTAWQERIAADLDRWAERDIRIFTVGARHDGVGVEIGTADVERARHELPERYGAATPLIFVEQGPVTPLRSAGPATAPQPGG